MELAKEPVVFRRAAKRLFKVLGTGTWTFYRAGEPVTLSSGMIFSEETYPEAIGDPHVIHVDTVPQSMADGMRSALFVRTYAHGDVIQLLPVVRAFARRHPDMRVGIGTTREYVSTVFRRVADIEVVMFDHVPMGDQWDLVVMLDGALERDHDPTHVMSRSHRCHQYAMLVLGCDVESYVYDREAALSSAAEVPAC